MLLCPLEVSCSRSVISSKGALMSVSGVRISCACLLYTSGMKALMDFIQKNIRYPEEARKNGIQGRVAVSVVIDRGV